jgi:dihydroxyacetone kinase-like protein
MDLAQLTAWIREYARVIGENAQHLTDLDAAIGDADHGINMERGMSAVLGALDGGPPADMSALCKQVGMTLVKSVGGASGPLYGTFFLRMAGALGSGDSVDAADFAKALRAGVEGVVQRGRAEAGDKTMFDALAQVAGTQLNRWSPVRVAPAISDSAASAISIPAPPRRRC